MRFEALRSASTNIPVLQVLVDNCQRWKQSERFKIDRSLPNDFIPPKRFESCGSLLGISLMDFPAQVRSLLQRSLTHTGSPPAVGCHKRCTSGHDPLLRDKVLSMEILNVRKTLPLAVFTRKSPRAVNYIHADETLKSDTYRNSNAHPVWPVNIQ